MVNRLQTARPEDRGQDGLINWDKSARFGAILAIIPDLQSRGPPVVGQPSSQPSTAFRSMFQSTPLISSDEVSLHIRTGLKF